MEPDGDFARALYSYKWTPQVEPFGVRHDTMDYPGVPVDHASVEKRWNTLLSASRDEFVAALSDVPPKPAAMDEILRVNQGR